MSYYSNKAKPAGPVWTSDTTTLQYTLTAETQAITIPSGCVAILFSTAGSNSKIYIHMVGEDDTNGPYVWDGAGRPARYLMYIDPSNPPSVEIYTPGTSVLANLTFFYRATS